MRFTSTVGVVLLAAVASPLFAQDTNWTGGVDNDFLTAGNWSGGVPDTLAENAIIDGGANLPVVIPAGTGELSFGGLQLGTSGATGGHVIQNGGILRVSADFKSHVGDQGSLDSSWIMNGDSMLLYDEPESAGGAGFGSDGDGQDLEIGAQSGAGGAVGRMELHDNAILRISDDLKIGAEDNGNGQFHMDGNSQLTVGSGISVSESSGSNGSLTVAGNALLVSGNSAGPGRSDIGYTNEGYMTISRGGDSGGQPAAVVFRENAKGYIRTLQHRDGLTHVTVENDAEFHIFDVFSFAAPELGVATVATSNDFTSHVAQNSGSEALITIKDNGVMSVDSSPIGALWDGFAMSGGNNRGNPPNSGGSSTVLVQDSGSFTVQQDLHMTFGTAEDAQSTLKVVGPDATVAINGNLRMSIDDIDVVNPGSSILHSVITSSTHSVIEIGETAFIANGSLAIELDGYIPTGGESYTLVNGTIDGSGFRDVDFRLATLPDGLDWDLAINADSIVLSVLGSVLLCDFDGDSDCDIDDIDALITEIAAGTNNLDFDLNGDGTVDLADRNAWLTQAGSNNLPSGNAYLIGDANLDGVVDVSDFNSWNANKFSTSGNWSQGDFNADGVSDVMDFNLWNNNKFQSSDVVAVPEPATAVYVIVGLLGMFNVMRKSESEFCQP